MGCVDQAGVIRCDGIEGTAMINKALFKAENRMGMNENSNNPSPVTVIASGLHHTSQWVLAEEHFGLSVRYEGVESSLFLPNCREISAVLETLSL